MHSLIRKIHEELKVAYETDNIEVKNPGILEVPRGKNIEDLPQSHFDRLVNKIGYDRVIRALTNLEVWNKNKNKSLSKWASGMADKLKKKFRSEGEDFISKKFGQDEDEILLYIQSSIEDDLDNMGIEESEFKIEDMRLYGSIPSGKSTDSSDLDVILLYSGDYKEDDAFNMLHNDYRISDINGKDIPIDINPISTKNYVDIDDYVSYLKRLEPKY